MSKVVAYDFPTYSRALQPFSRLLLDQVCNRLASGEMMVSVCQSEGMPTMRSVRKWMADDADVAKDVLAAEAEGFDVMAYEARKIADDSSKDWYKDKKGRLAPDHEHIQRSKLRVDTIMKLLSKLAPAKYGELLKVGDPEGKKLEPPAITILPVASKRE